MLPRSACPTSIRRMAWRWAAKASVRSAPPKALAAFASKPPARARCCSYDYSAAVSGKVAAVGGRMLEGAAKIVLRQLFEQLGRQAGGGVAAPKRSLWQRILHALGVSK